MDERMARDVFEDYLEFKNSKFEPMEDLMLTFDKDGVKGKICPALDASWAKHRRCINYINPPTKNEVGEYPLGAKEDWLQRSKLIIEDLQWLLSLNGHKFWSQVMFHYSSLNAMKSFVKQTAPFYMSDFPSHGDDKDFVKAIRIIESLVFNVFLRLTTFKLSETEWMREKTAGNILYDNFIITVPFLMDLCICFARNNHTALSEGIYKIFQSQEKYVEDLKTTPQFITKVLKHIEDQLNSGRVGSEEPVKLSERSTSQNTVNIETLLTLVNCLLDTMHGLTSFMDVYKPAATIYHQQHFEMTLADFYENSVPVLCRQIDLVCNHEDTYHIYFDLKDKMDLARREILNCVHLVLSSCINTILQLKEELQEADIKRLADEYTNVLSECLADRLFMSEYQRAFPVEHDLDVLTQVCPEIDTCDFLLESIISCLNDQNINSNQTSRVSNLNQETGQLTNIENYPSTASTSQLKKVTGVELESLVTEVRDILPHLGDAFVQKCLDHFNYDSAAVINAVLENSLPEPLLNLDPEMPLIPPEEESTKETNGFSDRHNVFDNDEFDIMNRDDVDISRMHLGKRRGKHKNLIEMLDDKSHVEQMKDMFTQLSLVESYEENLYEDEYDDTYDEVDMAVGDEGETERRPFTVPRVLQRRISLPDEPEEELSEEVDERDKPKFEYFVPNPEDLRAKAEQRRQDRNRGRWKGPPGNQYDVVGKPKGQGQDKTVRQNREHKTVYKSRSGNHNRRAMASRKRNQGMMPS